MAHQGSSNKWKRSNNTCKATGDKPNIESNIINNQIPTPRAIIEMTIPTIKNSLKVNSRNDGNDSFQQGSRLHNL